MEGVTEVNENLSSFFIGKRVLRGGCIRCTVGKT